MICSTHTLSEDHIIMITMVAIIVQEGLIMDVQTLMVVLLMELIANITVVVLQDIPNHLVTGVVIVVVEGLQEAHEAAPDTVEAQATDQEEEDLVNN